MSFVRYIVRYPNGRKLKGDLYLQGTDLLAEIAKELRERPDFDPRFELLSVETLPACQGCRENQPNQQAHMEFGGCLYQEEC